MFKTGDYVIYGQNGICQVMDITTMNMDGVPKDRLYYVLRPDGQTEGKIFTPVDNSKLVIRRIMTRDEVQELIRMIPEIEVLDIADDRTREEKYKECLRSCESREMVRVIKTIHKRKKARMEQGKKITATDERYLKQAEDNLHAELGMLLGIPKNEIGAYISSQLSERQTSEMG